MLSRFARNEFVRHGSFIAGGVAIASLFNYLYYMLIGRLAGVEIYGEVTALTSAMLVVLAPGTIGQVVAARLAAALQSRSDPGALRTLADRLMTWTAAVAVAIVVAGVTFRGAIASFFNLSDALPVVVVVLSLGGYTIVTVQRGILQGSQRFGELAASTAIDALGRFFVGIALVGIWGATGSLLGVLTGVAAALLYGLLTIRARFGERRTPIALDRTLIFRVVSHVGLAQLTFTVLMFYDVPIIKHAFDARSAGLYAAAALVGRAVLAAVSFVATLIMPKVASQADAARSTLPLLGTAVAMTSAITAVALVAGLIAPRLVVTLIAGRAFGDAAPLVLPYIAASGALSFATVVTAYKTGLHRYDFVLPCVVVALVEISVLSAWHPTLQAAVSVLLVGHVALLGATLYRLTAPATRGEGVVAIDSPTA